MLKKYQCWRCDTISSLSSSNIPCSRCGVASYCSDECKQSDEFRHQVDCQTAALRRTCSGCGKKNTGLKPCGSCRQAWYCDKECQKNSWPTHKAQCQLHSRKTEDMSRQIKFVYGVRRSVPGSATVYYWGNIPAVDLINLPLNEGCDYSKPLSILVCGVGDPRNVVLSLSQLPEEYGEEVTFVLNDICACVMARTVLMLYILIKGGVQIAKSVTQIWYSLRLSEVDYQLVISTLKELINAPSLEELTSGLMKMEQNQLQKLVRVWRNWLGRSRKGNWITEARNRCFDNFDAKEGMRLFLEEIPKEHRKSASDWFQNGILSPKESRGVLPHENFTLTGSDFQISRNEGPFSYIIQSSVTPFSSWDYKDVHWLRHSPSILEMYNGFVTHVLKKCTLRLATGQMKFHFLLSSCMEMTPFLSPDRKYDRITTSNIADFVPLVTLLDTLKPLLNHNNPSSVIVTEFQNWVMFTDLMDEAVQRANDMPRDDIFRRKVLEDTKNTAIAHSVARQAFVEYHDHSTEFITFLRALLLAEIPDKNHGKRAWKSVADHNGLTARNFLRLQNRVCPAKWLLNCRRITMLNGFERAVEWIIDPK